MENNEKYLLSKRIESEDLKNFLENDNKKYTAQSIEWYKTTYLLAFADNEQRKENLAKLSLHMYSNKVSNKATFSFNKAFSVRKLAIHDALVDYYNSKNEVKTEDDIRKEFNDVMSSLPNIVVTYNLSKEDLEKYEDKGILEKNIEPSFKEIGISFKEENQNLSYFDFDKEDIDEYEFSVVRDTIDNYFESKRNPKIK